MPSSSDGRACALRTGYGPSCSCRTRSSTSCSAPSRGVLRQRNWRGTPPKWRSSRGSRVRYASMTSGTIIGRRRNETFTQRPTTRRTTCCSARWSRTPCCDASARAETILRLDRVEDGLVLGEAASVDLGAGDDLARCGIHHDDDRDEALLAEDAAILEVGIRDLTDGRAVDVDEAEVELADHLHLAGLQVEDGAVLAEEGVGLGDAGLLRERGIRPEVALLAVHGQHVPRLQDVVARRAARLRQRDPRRAPWRCPCARRWRRAS